MDRQDIDALLIGALYGELTPAEEAQLATHLESHPGDRGALDDLKVARQAVHESRIFAVQLEPPQAVSALLLQEAHRRAPKHVAQREEKEGWFARFTRNFMAHPAMAAAAMLVLVLGGAGVLYMKKGDAQFANKEVAMDRGGAPTGRAQLEAAENAATAPQSIVAAGDAGTASYGAADTTVAGSGYTAGLYEGEAKADSADKKAAESATDRWASSQEQQRRAAADEGRARADESAKLKKAAPSRGITVTTERAPKDFDDAPAKEELAFGGESTPKTGAAGGKSAKGGAPGATSGGAASGGAASTGGFDGNANAVTGAGASGRGTATGDSIYAQPPPPPAQAPAPNRPSGPAPAPTATATAAPRAPEPKPEPTKSAVAEKPAEKKAPSTATTSKAPSSATVSKAPPTAKPSDAPKTDAKDSSLVAWAKGEHARAVTLAKNGDCTAAAKVALAVSNRAAGYYSQYMATDRSLKQCAQYINAERDREAERTQKARAQKRVNADEPSNITK